MNNRVRAVEIALRQFSSLFQRDKEFWARSSKAGTRHRVFLSFVRQENGCRYCRFHHDNCGKTPISRLYVFRAVESIYETVRRAGLTGAESRQAPDEAVAHGRGISC
jgi:hypothetical protein